MLGKPVFLQHGVLGSSADWLIGPSDRALGNCGTFKTGTFRIIVTNMNL